MTADTPLRHATRGYGHRVLIASLFLPDTIQFHERDDSVIQTPRDQSSAPPSPTSDPAMTLALNELGNRLAGVSAAYKQSGTAGDDPSPSALSETEDGNTLLPPIDAKATPASKGVSPRRGSSGASGATSGHALSPPDGKQPTPQVNMTSLMAEATRPPANDEMGPPRRMSSSLSGGARPSGLSALTPADPTPSSSVADHGRSGAPSRPQASRVMTSATQAPPKAGGSTSSAGDLATSPPTTTTISLAAPRPASRRGSVSTEAGSGSAQPSSTPASSGIEGTGTRTPGASVAGKAGTLQPLSIISDLQARRSQLASLAPLSTPGDAERHHPFGGGAVTPLRGTQTPGLAPRPPGAGPHPHGAQTPGASKAGHAAPSSGSTSVRTHHASSSLSMTKATHDSQQVQRTGSAQGSKIGGGGGGAGKGGGAVTTGTATPHLSGSTMKRGGSDTGSYFPLRPALSRMNTNAATTHGSVSGSYNDHGRGAALDGLPTGGPVAPEAQPTPGVPAAARPPKKVVVSGASGETTPSTGANSPVTERVPLHRVGRKHSHGSTSGPAASPTSSFVRSSSRPRLGGSSGNRRSSTFSASRRSRRLSSDTLSTFAEDVGVGDESPEGFASAVCHHHHHSGPHTPRHHNEEADEELPPYDFVSNPSSNGGLVNAISALSDQRKLRGPRGGKVFVGTPSIHADEEWMTSRHRRSIAQRYRDEKASVPVWVKGDVFRGAYSDFCKGILWPTFHYTLPSDKALENEHEAFEAYRQLNVLFARKIAEEWKEGDIVLINDYHLLLVPQMLRDLVPSATIGLFVHIAFPSSELFRCLAMRETLLRGMLGADLVGFQTVNFCRHFRQTVSRILQLEATPKGVQTETLFTTVSSFPIGIDPRNLNAKRADPDVSEWVQRLTERYEGKKVIVGRDKMDWIRGVRQKLLAFELFLNEHPEWVGKVVLIQVALATGNNAEDNDEAGEANNVVSRINSRFSSLTYQPVVFLHVQDITFSQYLALLTVADAFLANSLREGMNLTTHEYIICQEEKQSPLILSEFTGTYSALRACIGINPWNTKQVAHAMHTALTMSREEQRARWADLHRTVVTQTALQWITSLLSRLERAHVEQQRRRESAFIPRFQPGQIGSEWRAAKTRLIVVDLEGSLLQGEEALFLRDAKDFEVPQRVLDTLRELTDDPGNFVYLLSGLSAEFLDRLSKACPGLGLVSEDGCSVKHPAQTVAAAMPKPGGDVDGKTSAWTSLTAGLDNSWKHSVGIILRYFAERTPGSFLHDRGSTLFFSTTDGSSPDPSEGVASPRHGAHKETEQEEMEAPLPQRRARQVSHVSSSSSISSPAAGDSDSHSESHDDHSPSHHSCSRFPHHAAPATGSQESQWARRQLAAINNLIYDSLGISLRIVPRGSTLTIIPKNVSRVAAVQHVVQLQAMGLLSRGKGQREQGQQEQRRRKTSEDGEGGGAGSATPRQQRPQSSTARMLSSARLDKIGLGSGSSSARWDHWHDGTLATGHQRNGPPAASSTGIPTAAAAAATAPLLGMPPTAAALAGSFDVCLYMGKDERVMSYCSSLDLPFAPLTVTTADEQEVELKGSEAGFCLGPDEDEEGQGEREQGEGERAGDDQGAGSGRVEETLRELAGFRTREERWGVGEVATEME